MSTEITSMFSSSNSIEYLVEQYMRLESRPKDALVNQKNELDQRNKILSDLDSTLSALESKAERLTDPITDYFAYKNAASSDEDKLIATAGATAQLGNHSISVDRLAIADTRVSKQYTDTDTSFTGFTTDQTFSIEVAHPTDVDESNRESISVTVASSVFTQEDEAVLYDIADAINSAMSTAVTAETIDSNEVVHASVVTEESGKSRLILRTEESGYTYRMDFTDSGDSLLAALEVNAAVQSSGTSGGYITNVGTSATDSELNAKFTVDGLTFYRDSNNVTDALTGVTLKLQDTFATDQTVTVTTDTDTVKGEVNAFLEAYNDALKFLKENTTINSTTYERGALADDITYRGIMYELRNMTITSVSGVSNSDFSKLFNIGIEADSEGYLSIEDDEKFVEALEANSTYVSEIFNASDGIAEEIKSYLDNYVKTGGTIDGSKNNIESQQIYLDDRIDLMDEILAGREAQLRREFTELQDLMYRLSNQQSFFSSFFG